MKNFIIALLVLVGITQFTPTQISAIESGSNDAAYYEAKKLEAQSASTKMRLEYYQKYKAKGYDMSLMTSDFLDASKTSESSFWEMLKKIQNTHEMVGRKEYVEKLRSK